MTNEAFFQENCDIYKKESKNGLLVKQTDHKTQI
jgi:hypothetical protein